MTAKKIYKNLLRKEDRTPQQRRESARKAGVASGEARRRKKTFSELAKAMLACAPTSEEIKNLKIEFPVLEGEELNNKALMIRRQMYKAVVEGDTKAFEVIRDTVGEKPKDNFNINASMKTKVIRDDI